MKENENESTDNNDECNNKNTRFLMQDINFKSQKNEKNRFLMQDKIMASKSNNKKNKKEANEK